MEPTIVKLLRTVLFLHLVTSISSQKNERVFRSVVTSRRVFKTVPNARSVAFCAINCVQDPCVGFSFVAGTKTCELVDSSVGTDPKSIWMAKDFVDALPSVNASLEILDVKQKNPNLNVHFVTALSDGGAFVRNYKNLQFSAVKVNSSGFADPDPAFTSSEEFSAMIPGPVNNQMIIAHFNDSISRVNLDNNSLIQTYNYGGYSVRHAILLQGNELLYVEKVPVTGRVLTYNLDTGSSDVKVTGLANPFGIASFTNSSITLYFVSENYLHRIRVYDAGWNHMYDFGGSGTGDGMLSYPRSLAISPEETLFVVDIRNDRIEEFSREGVWLRHVLTQSDGIVRPYDISNHPLHPDYIWVSLSSGNVKRFKIY